jgi:hypothetical protein
MRSYAQDLEVPAGVNEWKVGSNAADIPLPNSSVDALTLHRTFERFEVHADSGFIRECERLLKPGEKTIILPPYVNSNWTKSQGRPMKLSPRRRGQFQYRRRARSLISSAAAVCSRAASNANPCTEAPTSSNAWPESGQVLANSPTIIWLKPRIGPR